MDDGSKRNTETETKTWWNVMNVMDLYRLFFFGMSYSRVSDQVWAGCVDCRRKVIPHYQKAALVTNGGGDVLDSNLHLAVKPSCLSVPPSFLDHPSKCLQTSSQAKCDIMR